MKKKYSSPALARGVVVLELLADGDQLSMEAIAQATSLPKSSLSRILETLCDLELAGRDSRARRYYAMSRLVPFYARQSGFEDDLGAAMERIALVTDQTVEWYVYSNTGMVLVRRAEPRDREVGVRARVGYMRTWNTELEAVAALGYAWLGDPPREGNKLWVWNARGERSGLSANEVNQRIDRARQNGFAIDETFNSNGVRRIACVAGREQRPFGVLVIAQYFAPVRKNSYEKYLDILKKEAFALCGNSNDYFFGNYSSIRKKTCRDKGDE